AQEATDLYEASIKKTDTAKSVYDAAAKKLTQAQNKLQSLDPAQQPAAVYSRQNGRAHDSADADAVMRL
ncbi:hypothetical protein ONJ16_25985, partial [Salmonella enterica subsp. enterica serovar Montevideo]|nr:hypothetical protein [Salmonella enterica subsp. enterica serovar Montevideo]